MFARIILFSMIVIFGVLAIGYLVIGCKKLDPIYIIVGVFYLVLTIMFSSRGLIKLPPK